MLTDLTEILLQNDFPKVNEIDDVAQNILEKRYLHDGEKTWEDVVNRVISYVLRSPADAEIREPVREMMMNRYFIPNSPTLVNAGKRHAGLSACFVVDMQDTIESIFDTKYKFAMIARKGGGCGTTLSNLRPKNDPVAGSTHGYAGGPVDFFDTICQDMKVITQAGFRAMAMMGTMDVRHPDIKRFITAKSEEGVMTTTNISVIVDDAFMKAVEDDTTYWTEFGGRKYEELRAREIFEMMVYGAWRNGEPGIIFKERVSDSPYKYTGQVIQATNPCGEEPLPPNGVCNLGSIDISKFVENGKFNYGRFRNAVALSVKFLDRVIDVNQFPTKEIETWAFDNRPVGIGIMGYADYLLSLGIPYGSDHALSLLDDIMSSMYYIAKATSEELGNQYGIPKEPAKLPNPRRNITLLSIAPTGTISLLAGCSSSIEPIFSEVTIRKDKTGTYDMRHPLAHKEFFRCAVSGNGAVEVTWKEHIDTQSVAQRWVDAGVSKTINVPALTRKRTIEEMLMYAWKESAVKGLTIYRNQSRQVEVLTPKNIKHNKCPVCGADLIKESGCSSCSSCDYSVCEIG